MAIVSTFSGAVVGASVTSGGVVASGGVTASGGTVTSGAVVASGVVVACAQPARIDPNITIIMMILVNFHCFCFIKLLLSLGYVSIEFDSIERNNSPCVELVPPSSVIS
jgi:hypothetical protein